MQIQYNITRIEEWCKSHEMPEGLLQLEHLMQATKLLQLKKVSVSTYPCMTEWTWSLPQRPDPCRDGVGACADHTGDTGRH